MELAIPRTRPQGSLTRALTGWILYFGNSSGFSNCTIGVGRTVGSASNVAVTATNSPACSVSASPVAFGTVTSLAANIDAAGTISVNCSTGASYTVGLDGGVNGGTSATSRKMANGSNRVTYGLYRDSARSQGWYTDTGTTYAGTGNGTAQVINVYGRVPAQPSPTPGNYGDTVTVTLTY